MSTRPIESCYVSTTTSLQRLGTDFGLVKALCLGLAREVDNLRDFLSYSTNLVECQSDQLTRLRADNNRLRDQLADLQRLVDQRAEAVAGLLQQQPTLGEIGDEVGNVANFVSWRETAHGGKKESRKGGKR